MPASTRLPSRSSRQLGFTLIEMLVVLVIMAILLGVAGIPASADGGAAGLDLAEIQLKDAFTTAQTLSYSLGVPHGVVFDPAQERFAVVAQDGEAAKDPLTHGDYVVDFKSIDQPKGVTVETAAFGPTEHAGIFDAQGVPVAGGTVTLAKGGFTRTLVLDPATGHLKVP